MDLRNAQRTHVLHNAIMSQLREYIEREFASMKSRSSIFDLERVIDDWVFMCFFVGNDFLPHLPSLEIREGAIDRLIRLYQRDFARMDGYITEVLYLLRALLIRPAEFSLANTPHINTCTRVFSGVGLSGGGEKFSQRMARVADVESATPPPSMVGGRIFSQSTQQARLFQILWADKRQNNQAKSTVW